MRIRARGVTNGVGGGAGAAADDGGADDAAVDDGAADDGAAESDVDDDDNDDAGEGEMAEEKVEEKEREEEESDRREDGTRGAERESVAHFRTDSGTGSVCDIVIEGEGVCWEEKSESGIESVERGKEEGEEEEEEEEEWVTPDDSMGVGVELDAGGEGTHMCGDDERDTAAVIETTLPSRLALLCEGCTRRRERCGRAFGVAAGPTGAAVLVICSGDRGRF